MQLKVILNKVERHGSFVYDKVRWADGRQRELEIRVRSRKRSRPICSGCGRRGPRYDRLPPRRFQYVPLWGMAVYLVYGLRRVDCPRCGVKVERVPWADGKERASHSFQWFLSGWAKRLSWSETAKAFGTSWETVYRSVKKAVCYGLRHRNLDGVEAIGIDEVAHRKGRQYMTVVYQIDSGCRRLLWVGRKRTKRTVNRFFRMFGRKRSAKLKYVCSDMLASYISVVARKAGAAVHVLDRFHVAQLFSKAIDQVRAEEVRELKRSGYEPVLHRSRWLLLKRKKNRTKSETVRLGELLKHNLKTVKAHLLAEDFQRYWTYKSSWGAGRFFADWLARANRTEIKPIQKVARTLEKRAELICNWHEAKGSISSGAVEGMNLKIKLTTRRSYGFRSEKALKYALYHNLGKLPEPELAHRFC